MTPEERETTISASDGDDTVRIWTAQKKVITRLRKDTRFTEIESGRYEGSAWASFTIPSDQWNPASGAKKRYNLSEEEKQKRADRAAAMRAAKVS